MSVKVFQVFLHIAFTIGLLGQHNLAAHVLADMRSGAPLTAQHSYPACRRSH